MSQTKSKILPLFKELSTATHLVSASNLLIEDSIRIAKHYLYTKRTNLYKFILNDEVQVFDLAIDAIAPLFCKNPDDGFLPILKEFNSWQPPIKNEDDVLFFLNNIIASRVDQYISQILKEHDPFFAKILDSVNYLAKIGGYKKLNHFGKKYIIKSNEERIKGKAIDHDSFDQLPVYLFKNRKTMVAEVFNYLENETSFFPAIPLNSLVLRLRQFSASTQGIQSNTNGADTNFDVEEIVKFGVDSALSKLHDSYYSKGKLTDSERKYFEKVIQHIANDLRDGGVNRGLCAYLTFYMPDLEKQVYEDKYHNILEYLVKVMKNKIRERLIEDKK